MDEFNDDFKEDLKEEIQELVEELKEDIKEDIQEIQFPKPSKTHFWGEILCEIGILILVFGPLCAKFEAKDSGYSLFINSCGFIVFSSILIVLGYHFKRKSV